MLVEKFKFGEFARGNPADRGRRCKELAEELRKELQLGPTFGEAANRIIAQLRSLGHDLWSYDEDVDRQIWGHDYKTRRPGAGLLIELGGNGNVEVQWAPPKEAS